MPPKRKRNDGSSEGGGPRPSPHRPADTALAQHERDAQDNRRRSGAVGRNTRARNAERRNSTTQLNTAAAAGSANGRVPPSPVGPRPASSSSQVGMQTPNQPALYPSATQPPAITHSQYNYLVLTDARIATWQQGGRQEVIQYGITSRQDEDVEEITTISQEFAMAALENRLDPLDAGTCISEILGPEPEAGALDYGFNAQILFVDTISILIETNADLPNDRIGDFILAAGLSPQVLRQMLDSGALEKLGLIRQHFGKMGVRYATNQLYRQSNYNLLREETEGYSKLIIELYQTSWSLNQEQITREDVEAGFERMKALIGTFDLDVGRVLDIIFDNFAAQMMRTFRYFTIFLRASSWWPRSQVERYDPVLTGGLPRWGIPGAPYTPTPEEKASLDERRHQRDASFWDRAREVHVDAFFELGGRRVKDGDIERLTNSSSDASLKTELEIEWAKTTKTLPPTGNRVAAQLYGFKLRYYTSQARKDKMDVIQANLIFLAAYLIKIGFISITDLYAHLWPDDEKMDIVKEKRSKELEEKEKKERQGVEPNALLRAGALPDDEAPRTGRPREAASTKPTSETKDGDDTKADEEAVVPEPQENLKMMLVQHLFLVGAIPEALFMLGKFPWLLDAYPDEVTMPINRILDCSIDKLHQATKPKPVGPTTTDALKAEIASDQSGVPKGDVKLNTRPPPRTLKWPYANGFTRGTPYEYYLKEWSDNVPVCQTIDDLFTLCSTFLNLSGVNIGRTPTLLKKLAVIGAMNLKQDRSQHNLDRWQDLLKRIIFPALHFTGSNVDAAVAVWDLLKNYPTQIRFGIFAECYEGSVSRSPAMAKAAKYARLDTLAVLKRLSRQNIANSAKNLAKVALFSPGVVCKVALAQIEAYTNLIEAFVECAKYFTDLGHDVLVWSLMSSLGGQQRSRTQESSVLLTSKWLQALSKFSGKIFRRYSDMDLTPVIQYVNDQLAHGNSTDLVILRELITSMGGIVSDIDFTDAQLAALSGGEELRRQTLINLGDHRFDASTTKSASRLMKALVESKLAPRLLTNLAQYRQSAIFQLPENETHIKLLATIIDDSQQALSQFVELLRSNLSPEQFDELVPSIPTLMSQFGLDANLAFLIGRASLAYYLTGPGASIPKGRRLSGTSDAGTEAETVPSADTKVDVVEAPSASDDPMSIDEQENKEKTVDAPSTILAPNGRKSDRFLDVLHPIIDAVQPLYPAATWQLISPDFYVIFWSLQTGDLGIPASSYNAESIRLQKEQEHLKKDRSDMSRSGHTKREERKKEITQLATKLASEASQCQERVGKTRMLLLKSAPTWVPAIINNPNAVADAIIEECLVPRLLLSPGDADFCHKMVKFLHEYQVSNFKVTALYDRFFTVNRLRSIIFACTVREAEFLGRFIKLSLGELSRWHKKKETYEKEAVKNGKHVAFATAFDNEGKPSAVMDHNQFRDLLWSWHQHLATALKSCLQGSEWMHIRNAITILKAVLEYFPAVDFQGKQLLQILGKIRERESASKNDNDDGQGHRVDLSVTAESAMSALKKHESKWMMVQAFRPNTTGDSSDDKKATETPSLRPNAPEFKPQQATSATPRTRTVDDEDGEVKDLKLQSAGLNAPEGPKELGAGKSEIPQRPAPVPQRTAELARPSSRPSTPSSRSAMPSPASSSTKRDAAKSSSLASLPQPPGLPSRPDVPFPSHFAQDELGQIRLPAHAGEHREPRDHRDPRNPREPRDAREIREPREAARPVEGPRPSRGRESFGTDRRALDTPPKDAPRSERERLPRTEPPRWNPADREVRPPRDRAPAPNAIRGSEPGRLPREPQADSEAMPPPPPVQADPQGPPVNPERARFLGVDEMINPARAALIQPREDGRDRRSRHNSPPRRTERTDAHLAEPSRDERTSRSHRSEHHSSTRDSRGESSMSATPRTDRTDRDPERSAPDRLRDLGPFQGPNAGPRGEPDHNRSSQQDLNYGRLNAGPTVTDPPNPPDAPRGRGRNSSHSTRPPASASQPPTRSEARFPSADQSHRAPSPDRQQFPPTGPASSRPRRGPAGPTHGSSSSMNASPPAGVPAPGIHPDRLRNLGPGTAPPSQGSAPFPGSGPNSVAVHPDRMGHIAAPPTGPSHPGRSLPPLQTLERLPHPGSGSHSRQPSHSHPITPGTDQSNSMSAPTGPAATNDRSRTGRQLQGINSIIQGANSGGRGGTSMRGRPRASLAGSDAQVLTGASPVSTPVQERPDPMTLERGGINGDDRSGLGRRHHDHSERTSRSSRHASRERSSGRDTRSSKEHREHRTGERDFSAGVRDPTRESSRRSTREGPSHVSGSARGESSGSGREIRHRTEGGSSSRHEGGRGGMGSGMGAHRDGDEGARHREPRGDEIRASSRKRRSEEGGIGIGGGSSGSGGGSGGYAGPPPDGVKRQRQMR